MTDSSAKFRSQTEKRNVSCVHHSPHALVYSFNRTIIVSLSTGVSKERAGRDGGCRRRKRQLEHHARN